MRPVQRRFERLLTTSRLLALIPVIFLLLDAAGSFLYGSDILLRTATGDVREPAHIGGRLGLFLVVMDTYLVGATLMIAAFGFYELFVIKNDQDSHRYWLPRWLKARDLEDLKARVDSMLILVAAITFVDRLVESHDEPSVLYLGGGIGLVIVALTLFLRFGFHARSPAGGAPPGGAGSASHPGPPGDPGAARTVPAEDAPRQVPAGPGAGDASADEPGRGDAGPARTRVVAVLGAAHRAGRWSPGAVTAVVAAAGAARIDLSDAVLPGERIALNATAVLGVVTVTVPPWMQVDDSGLALLGIRRIAGAAANSAGPAAALSVSGPCVLGWIRVRIAS